MKRKSVLLTLFLTMMVATQAFAIDKKVEDPVFLGINSEIHTNTRTGMQETPILKDSVLYLTKGISFTADNRVVTSDKKIVSVSKLKFTGKKVGSTVLELDGMNYNTDVFTAKVSTKQTQKGYIGDTFEFTLLDSTGKDLKDLNIAWQSSNQNVAQVDDGKVMLVGKGNASIYAYLQGKKYTFKVSSKYKDGMTLVYNSPLNKVVNLNTITGQKVTAIETDSNRVEIQKIPKVKVLQPGLSVLKVTTKTGSCTVNLYGETANRSSDSKITTANNKKYLNLAIGETEYLNFPGVHQIPLWKSSNNKVAVVSEYGVVIPLKEGKTTLSATVAGSTYKVYLTVKGEARPPEKETYREIHVLDSVNDQVGKSVWVDPNGNAYLDDPTLKYFAVIFDTNGSDDVIETQSILEGNTAVRPTDPVRPEYVFSHWSLNGLLYNFTEPVLSHVTLLANWIHVKGYLFIDTNNDGINDTQLPVDDAGKVIGKFPTGSNGLPITEVTYIDPNGKTKRINLASDTIPEDLLNKQENTVDGKTPTDGDTEIEYIKIDTNNDGETDTVIVVDANTRKIIGDLPRDTEGNKITKITYVDPDGKTQTVDLTQDEIPSEIVGDDSIVVKPSEDEKTYTVEFATNGGTSIPKQVIASGAKATKPETPEREEYLFKNWYLHGQVYDFDSPVTSNLILVAEWQHIRGHLYIDTDGDGEVDTRLPVDDNGNIIGDFPKDNEGNEIKQITVTDENGNKTVVNLDTGHITSDIIKDSRNEDNPTRPATQEEVELYGVTHVVTFNTSGGTDVPDQHVLDGETAERPEVPSRQLGATEYTFCDWVLYGNSYNFDTPVITDLGLRATWKQATGEVYIINSDGTKTKVPFAEDATINEDYFVVPAAEGYVEPTAGETIEDYHFEGWFYTGKDGKLHRYYPKSDLLEEGTELIPKFVKNAYTVTFDANGGTNLSATSKTVHYGEAYGDLPTVELSGKDFVGWYTQALGGEHVLETTLMDKESNHTLYAHFADKTYEITFNSNGGSEVEKQRAVYNEKIGNLPVPTQYGKSFDGWYLNNTKVTSDTVYTFTSNLTLVARWTAKQVLVVFDSDGGQITETMKRVNHDTEIGDLPVPEKEGYDFVGWYDEPSGGTKYTASSKVTDETSLLLYAHYILKTYTVTFNSGGKTNTILKQAEVPYNAVISSIVTVSTPSRDNFTFEGWKLPDGTPYTNATKMPASPLIITATWTSNSFTVTFDTQGGTLEDSSEVARSVHFEDTYGELPEVSREHYKFEGWYTMPDGVIGTLITKDSIYSQTTNTIVYAHWSPNPHTLTLVPGKGMDNFSKVLKYNENIGSIPVLGVEGHTFAGWYYSNEPDAVKVQSTDKMPDDDISIYAHWTPNSYKVTFDANGGVFGTSPTTFKTITYGEVFGALEQPVYEGYNFVKYIGPEGEEITASTIMSYVSPITVKVIWSKNTYVVTYKDSEGNDYSIEPKNVTYGEPYGELYTPDEVPGQTFIGWNTKADGTGLNISSTDTVTIAMNHTLYSMYGTNVYTITFDSQGGTAVAPWTRSFDTVYGSLPTPTKQGYILEGWYDIDVKVLETDKVPARAVTLTARWSPDTHTIYTVKHYKMTIDGTGYVLEYTDTLYGTTGENITPVTETYTGFTSPALQTVEIKADGSTLVEYQYTRNKHNFTVNNVDGCSTLGSTASGEYYYGTQINLNATVSTGYDWSKWSNDVTSTSTSFTMPDTDVTVSPVVTLHQYSIEYTLDGGTLVDEPTSYTVNTNTFTLPRPTKTDMVFLGWTGSNGTTAQLDVVVAKGSTGNLVYTANWKMKTGGYIVKHMLMNLDGETYSLEDEQDYSVDVNTEVTPDVNTYTGFTSPETQTITVVDGDPIIVEYLYSRNKYNFTLTEVEGCDVEGGTTGEYYYGKSLTLVATPQTGYDWSKWSDNTTTKAVTITMPASAVTISPIVTVHEYDITYELNGGALSNPVNKYTILTDNFILPKPVRDGRTFTGWTGSNGTTPQVDVTVTTGTTGDLSYVANYDTVSYSITYTLSSGGTIAGEKTVYDIETDTFILPTPSRDGYTFIGWTGSNGTEPELSVIVEKGTTGNLAYVANWDIITYTISYNLNDGEITGQPTEYDVETSTFTLPSPTKTGYTFDGWTGSNGDEAETSVEVVKGTFGNLSYEANWSPVNYTVEYTLEGGSMSGEKTQYTIESDTFTLPSPTKTGYNFLGWTGSNGTTPQTTVTIDKGSTGNKTYIANWEVVTYTITYELADGSMSGQKTSYNITTDTFTLPTPTKTGYTFNGWTGSNGTTPQTSVSITKGSTGNKNYVANWTAVNYTITYNLGGGSITGQKDTYTIDTDTFTLPTPTKTGSTFTGWTGSNGETAQTSVSITKGTTGNKTYTANWEVQTATLNISYIGTSYWGVDNSSTINYSGVCEKVSQKSYQIPVGDTVRITGNNCTSRTLYIYNYGTGTVTYNNLTSTVGTSGVSIGSSRGVEFEMPEGQLELRLDGYSGSNSYYVIVYAGSVRLKTLNSNILNLTYLYSSYWGNSADSTISFGDFSEKVQQKAYAIPEGTEVTIYGNNHTKRPLYMYNNTSGKISYNGTQALNYGSGSYYNNNSSITTSGIKFNEPNEYLELQLYSGGSYSYYYVDVDAGSVRLSVPEG